MDIKKNKERRKFQTCFLLGRELQSWVLTWRGSGRGGSLFFKRPGSTALPIGAGTVPVRGSQKAAGQTGSSQDLNSDHWIQSPGC